MESGKTLTEACREPGMPTKTVYEWTKSHPEFDEQYRTAQLLLADALADQMKSISEDRSRDIVVDAKGKERVDWECVNRSKLRIDTLRWLVAKLNPAKYQHKNVQELTGPAAGPIKIEAQITDEQRVRVLQVLLAKHAIQNGPLRLLENAKASWDD